MICAILRILTSYLRYLYQDLIVSTIEVWRSAKEYVTLLGRWGWVVLVDVLFAAVGAYLDIRNAAPIPPWAWISLLLIALLVTPFVAIHKLRLQRDQLTQQIERQRRKSEPELVGAIEQSVVGEVQGFVRLILFIKIRNLGMPSIVDPWSVFLTIAGAQEKQIQIVHPDGPIPIRLSDGRKVTIESSDAIYNKTNSQPIPTGGQVTGFIACLIRDVPLKVLDQPGNRIAIRCWDVTGKQYSFDATIPEVTSDLEYIPGLKTQKLEQRSEPSNQYGNVEP